MTETDVQAEPTAAAVADPIEATLSGDPLRDNIRLLGRILGQTINSAHGDPVLEQVESIRKIAHAARKGEQTEREALTQLLSGLSDDEMLIVARAFNQFLNLANIAEQYQSILQVSSQPTVVSFFLSNFYTTANRKLALESYKMR